MRDALFLMALGVAWLGPAPASLAADPPMAMACASPRAESEFDPAIREVTFRAKKERTDMTVQLCVLSDLPGLSLVDVTVGIFDRSGHLVTSAFLTPLGKFGETRFRRPDGPLTSALLKGTADRGALKPEDILRSALVVVKWTCTLGGKCTAAEGTDTFIVSAAVNPPEGPRNR